MNWEVSKKESLMVQTAQPTSPPPSASPHDVTSSPRTRFLSAIANQQPDRVPAAPDISNYIPARRTGLPFWDIYYYGQVPLWRAYLDAMDYFGGEAWVASCCGAPLIPDQSRIEVSTTDHFDRANDAMIRRTTICTPSGTLTAEDTCFRFDPPSPTQKLIKDLERDFAAYKWTCRPALGINQEAMTEMREECHRRQQAFGVTIGYPGFHMWFVAVQGGLETLTYALTDCPAILDEWAELDLANQVRTMELVLECRPDYVLLGGSGTITMASPDLARRYAIPALSKLSQMARAAGLPVMLHSCGKSRTLVDLLVEHTAVTSVNPLEIAPMGDADLAEIKRAHGRHIGLMGNLHTTEVMLRGTPELVRRKSLEAMQAAGPRGGFVLSTGDQCGRETPEANLFALIETAREFGGYDGAGNLPAVDEALGTRPD